MNQLSLAQDQAKTATISPCGRYRYSLGRRWVENSALVLWVMLNPSTADHEKDDPTIAKITKFTKRFGYGAFAVVNLYAYRATDPKAMFAAQKSGVDIVGPDNDKWIAEIADESRVIIVAWGANAEWSRVRKAMPFIDSVNLGVDCLSVTKSGHPGHPLYLPDCSERMDWSLPEGFK